MERIRAFIAYYRSGEGETDGDGVGGRGFFVDIWV